MLTKLNYNVMFSLLGDRLVLLELVRKKPSTLAEIAHAFLGNIDGLTNQITDKTIKLIQREKIEKVFVDGSNLGGFVAKLKRTMPGVEVITFFHNVEARFFWGAFRASKSMRAFAVFLANYLAEKVAVRYSDKRICLSVRDSKLLQSVYGEGATHISPIAVEDKFMDLPIGSRIVDNEPFALFVGGNFYANREGIIWFVREVAPKIDIKVCVVGKGMENIREELETSGRVQVIGPVDNLAEWYRNAHFTIAPIFDGSGMKTKIAEALMYGKRVIGTPEAFSGYEDIVDSVGWQCASADEFVAAIQAAQRTIKAEFDPFLREIYERRYSFHAAKMRLAQVLFA